MASLAFHEVVKTTDTLEGKTQVKLSMFTGYCLLKPPPDPEEAGTFLHSEFSLVLIYLIIIVLHKPLIIFKETNPKWTMFSFEVFL